jgi:NarL family two-component system response regulator LiaR
MIRLLVIEDHPVAVTGLRNMFRPLRDGIEIASFESSIDKIITNVDPGIFDMIVLDLYLFNSDPLDNLNRLRLHFPSKPIVIFSSEESDDWQRKMFNAGVKAYIFKSASRKEIMGVIVKVYEGKIVFSDFILHQDVDQITEMVEKGVFTVTKNQKIILQYISQGMPYKAIADIKHTTTSSIEKTMNHLRRKYSAHNNAELISILRDRNVL